MPDGLPLLASIECPHDVARRPHRVHHHARAGEIIRPTDLHARGMVRGELARTHALLGDLDPADWLRLTDCTGWRVRDVVAHIISGNEELPRPARLIRRVRTTRGLAGPDDGMAAARDRSVTVPGAPASS